MNSRTEAPPSGGASHFGEDVWKQLNSFVGMLEREGELRGLVGPRELERLWTRHILNSTPIVDYIGEGTRVADVGSGAGFPGIVAAIVRPDLELTLIDSMDRRCQWLRDVKDELSLDNVKVLYGRSEDFFGKIQVDVVTARAVAALKKLIPWTFPLLRAGGELVTLKGVRVDDEIDEAVPQLRKFRADWADVHKVVAFGTDEPTRVLVVKKM